MVLCFFNKSVVILSIPGDDPFFNFEIAFNISSVVIVSNLFKEGLFWISVLFNSDGVIRGVFSILRFCICATKSDATLAKYL